MVGFTPHEPLRPRPPHAAAPSDHTDESRRSHPEHAALIARVLAIPPNRYDRALVSFLTEPEVDAPLAAPDSATETGRRDHALLLVAPQSVRLQLHLVALAGRPGGVGRVEFD